MTESARDIQSLHVWFADGWQLHLFGEMGEGTLYSSGPGPRRLRLDDPAAAPYLAALAVDPELAAACQGLLGLAPWELAGEGVAVRREAAVPVARYRLGGGQA